MSNELYNLLEISLKKYPEFKNYKIFIGYRKLDCAYAEFTVLNNKSFLIDIDIKLKGNRRFEIAAIASELSHIVLERKLSIFPFGSQIEGIFYNHSKIYRNFDEKRTDKETIKRGFGKELLDLKKGHDDEDEEVNEEEYEEEGLTIKEIEKLIEG